MKRRIILGLLVVLLLTSVFVGMVNGVQNSTFIETLAGNVSGNLSFDRFNTTINTSQHGSNSYIDHNPTNPDLTLFACHDNLSNNYYADLVYFSTGGNITASLLHYLPAVTSVTNAGSYNCTEVNVALASTKALYPGLIQSRFYDNPSRTVNNNTLYFDNNFQHLNGSYEMDVRVQTPPKTYLISTSAIYDQNSTQITTSGSQLVTSILDSNGSLIQEELLAPGEPLSYQGSLQGGERVYVNGILALEIKIQDGCGNINESGYYILNNSLNNVNSSCIVIENLTNIVLNFGGEIIDGDNLTNGSQQISTCPVQIKNSVGVAIEDLQTQQFYYGLCVENSTNVTIFGIGSSFNSVGAIISNNSEATFQDISFANDEAEVLAINDSLVSFIDVNFSSPTIYETVLQSSFYNVNVTSVVELPPDPSFSNVTDIENIGQFIEYNTAGPNAWAQISFVYPDPIPNNVVADNISVLKYNGTYANITNTTVVEINGTNVTVNTTSFQWVNGSWSILGTLIQTNASLIIGPNLTDFSVFAPFGFETEPETEPEPEPDPSPDSGSSSGGGGGGSSGGGSPGAIVEDTSTEAAPAPVELEIEVPEYWILEQGQPGEIEFNLSNTGDLSAEDIVVRANVPESWGVLNTTIPLLDVGETINDLFFIQPYEKAVAKEYQIRVDAYIANGSQLVTSDFLTLSVVPSGEGKKMQIIEYPPVIRMPPSGRLDVAFLVENRGSRPLEDVTIKYQESTCLARISGSNDIDVAERKIITYSFFSKQAGECEYNVLFYDQQDVLVGFVPITLQIEYENALQAAAKRLLLMLLTIWTGITIFIILRKRRAKKKEEESYEG